MLPYQTPADTLASRTGRWIQKRNPARDIPNYKVILTELDKGVGRILDTLTELGLDENTFVFFWSDNGAVFMNPHPERRPYRGGKFSNYEGGHRVPAVARWPGRIAAGTETNLLSAHYDFMATMAELIGASMPNGKDSISYLPTLLGKPQSGRHDYVVISNGFRQMGRTALITKDGWKLVEIDRAKDQFQLYHIAEDNEERYNLEMQHPEMVNRLKTILLQEIDSARPDIPK